MVIPRAADVWVEDWRLILGSPWHRSAIELGVQDGFDGTVGFGADLDCPLGGSFDTGGAIGVRRQMILDFGAF